MIVWLSSYPRSGNTLFRLVLHQSFGQSTYSVYNDPRLARTGVGDLIGQKHFNRNAIPEYMSLQGPVFVKTHGHEESDEWRLNDDSPVIYIVRDGRDALVSYAHYRIDIESCKIPFDRLLRDLTVGRKWGGWSGHARDWLITRESKQSVAIVRYEDLLTHPFASVQIALTQIGLGYVASEGGGDIESFGELRRMYPRFFRKGKTGTWKTEMGYVTEEMFWQMHGATMQMLGYVR